jgi:uncharacterized OB-fold protein
MAFSERLTNVDEMRFWKDQIPFHYEYTAGVAGERFLRGLQSGKLLAGKCDSCGKMYLPPKMYCVDCYRKVTKMVEVGPSGVVSALTESHVSFDGRHLEEPVPLVFVTFKGVTGGLIQKAVGRLRIGAKVAPRFKPRERRKGSLDDIEAFEAA